MKLNKIPVSSLIEDFDFYPRGDVDSSHVRHLIDAKQAGADLPPIIVWSPSMRIIDGFHRRRAWRSLFGEQAKIECELRTYPDDKAAFEEAMRLNATHGRNLTQYDRTIAIEKALSFGIDPDRIATALNIKTSRITSLKQDWQATVKNTNRRVALKLPLRHLAGQEITEQQAEVNDKLVGNRQLFMVNQLILLLKNDLIERDNETLNQSLRELRGLLKGF